MKPSLPLPTAKELQLLNILWKHGPTTVRTIHENIKKHQNNKQKYTAYTTTLKMMQVMHQKGLVKKDTKPVAHIYTTTLSREQTQTQLLNKKLNIFTQMAIFAKTITFESLNNYVAH